MTETINDSTENKKIYKKKIVIISIFLILLALRLIYLDADPSFIKRVSDLGDEGIWVHNARTLFVFNDLTPDDATQSLSVSPLNTLFQIISFKLLGVNTFAARLPSAIAGWFTLLILYFFLKKAWGEKAAFVGLLMLGLNETFLIYNKIALGISLEAMFIVLSFFLWYKGAEKKYFYFLAGISFALAILSKLSAYYFALIFLVIWLLELYRKESNFSTLILFGIGGLIPLIPYSLFLFTNWQVLSTNFLVLMQYYNSNGVIIFNFFRVFANNFFGLPGVFFLIIFTTIYFLTENKFKKIRTMDRLELIACCWLVIGLILLIALSDLSDRRFFGLILPLSILSTKLILELSNISISSFKPQKEKYTFRQNVLHSFLFSYPLTSFIVSGFSLFLCRPINQCNNKQPYMIILFMVIFIVTILILRYTKEKINSYVQVLFHQTGIFLIILLPFSTLTRHFARHFAIISSTLNKETTYILSTIFVVGVLFLVFHLLSLYFPHRLHIKRSGFKKLFLIYVLIMSLLIGLTFIAPSFSLKEASSSLGPLLGNTPATGFLVQTLSYEAYYLPILTNGGSFETVNGDYDKNKLKYVLIAESLDGYDSKPNDELSNYNNKKFIKRFYLYPYPFTEKYKLKLSVYSVERYTMKQERLINKEEKYKP